MMTVEAIKFLVSTTKLLVGGTEFGTADQKIGNAD